MPVELSSRTLAMTLNDLFWYRCCLIWLVMTALVSAMMCATTRVLRIHARVERLLSDTRRCRPSARLVEHLIGGCAASCRRRGVGLTLSSGVSDRHADRRLPLHRLGGRVAVVCGEPFDRPARPRQLAAPLAGCDAAVRQPLPGFLDRHPDRACQGLLPGRNPGNSLRAAEAGASSGAARRVISRPAVRSANSRAARC